MTIKWQAGRITKIAFKTLDKSKTEMLSKAYRQFGQAIKEDKRKGGTWAQCFTYEHIPKEKRSKNGKHMADHQKLYYTLF